MKILVYWLHSWVWFPWLLALATQNFLTLFCALLSSVFSAATVPHFPPLPSLHLLSRLCKVCGSLQQLLLWKTPSPTISLAPRVSGVLFKRIERLCRGWPPWKHPSLPPHWVKAGTRRENSPKAVPLSNCRLIPIWPPDLIWFWFTIRFHSRLCCVWQRETLYCSNCLICACCMWQSLELAVYLHLEYMNKFICL